MYNPFSLDVDVEIGTVAYNTDSYVGAFNRSTGTNIIGELDFNRGLNGNIKVEQFLTWKIINPYTVQI